jgi:hypothetical protein
VVAVVREPDEPFEPRDPEARRLPPPAVPQPTTVVRAKELQDAGLLGKIDAPEPPQPTVVVREPREVTVTETVVETDGTIASATVTVTESPDDGTTQR